MVGEGVYFAQLVRKGRKLLEMFHPNSMLLNEPYSRRRLETDECMMRVRRCEWDELDGFIRKAMAFQRTP